MYIIELIIKLAKKIREKRELPPIILPDYEENQSEEFQEDCENHIYLPIDSTKSYLACKNCGHIIKNPDL